MNQLERAKEIVILLCTQPLSITPLRDLQKIIDEAQNPPPQGGADGSINPFTWDLLKKISQSVQTFQKAHRQLFLNDG